MFELFRKYIETDKEDEDEVDWNKIFDKRTRCLLNASGVYSSSESIRCKVLQIEDIELLESLRTSLGNISEMYRNYSAQYSKTRVVDYIKSETRVNPNFKQLRRMEVHSLCCEIQVFCKEVKPFINTTMNDSAIGQFFNIMFSTNKFLEKTVMDNPIFHAIYPTPPRRKRYSKFY